MAKRPTTATATTNTRLNEFMHFMEDHTKRELGALLADYINESCHSSWEGFQPSEVRAISRMLEDMRCYWENLSQPGQTKLTNDRATSNGITFWTKD